MGLPVDSSVWVSFFRGAKGEEGGVQALDYLISGDEAVVNEVIKSEVMPMMIAHGEDASPMDAVRSHLLSVDWPAVRDLQVRCLKNGLNKIGVSDLVIALDSVSRGEPVFSLDRHFRLIAKVLPELRFWPK